MSGIDFDALHVGLSIPAVERQPSAVDLFQMSATLGIAHRIHYDAPYTTEIEGHPGLLVQGPLQASYMLQAVLNWLGPAKIRLVSFTFRHLAPAYVDAVIRCEATVIEVNPETGTATFEVNSFNVSDAKLTVGQLVVGWTR